jgi:hypothetical protein
MLKREIIADCSEIHTKHLNTLGAERRILNVKLVGNELHIKIQPVPRSKHIPFRL